jgi:predicted dehydrogenase
VASRREFLTGTAALAGAALTLPLLHTQAYAAGGDNLKIGLVGCGGRGTGAAAQALKADPNVELVALGDMFPERANKALSALKSDEEVGKKVKVDPQAIFTGFDSYKKVIGLCDVVLLCSPPAFRPSHLAAAVAAGKHIFCEKPIATDPNGVRSVIETSKKAREKNLALVSGLCWRYHHGTREFIKRVQDGGIGQIVTAQSQYLAGELWHVKREPQMSDMEWQIRNWLYFTWLSGDHIVEQAIHSLDKIAWVLGDKYPVKAYGLGGRQKRTDPTFGHIFDHHAVVYEYADGQRCFFYTRQQQGTFTETNDYIFGSEGTADWGAGRKMHLTGKNSWAYKPTGPDDMYQNEHNELFASIRAGKPINNGEYMCNSTLMAILGRMATYSGKVITWDQALNMDDNLFPEKLEFGPHPVPEVAIPGITKPF